MRHLNPVNYAAKLQMLPDSHCRAILREMLTAACEAETVRSSLLLSEIDLYVKHMREAAEPRKWQGPEPLADELERHKAEIYDDRNREE